MLSLRTSNSVSRSADCNETSNFSRCAGWDASDAEYSPAVSAGTPVPASDAYFPLEQRPQEHVFSHIGHTQHQCFAPCLLFSADHSYVRAQYAPHTLRGIFRNAEHQAPVSTSAYVPGAHIGAEPRAFSVLSKKGRTRNSENHLHPCTDLQALLAFGSARAVGKRRVCTKST